MLYIQIKRETRAQIDILIDNLIEIKKKKTNKLC